MLLTSAFWKRQALAALKGRWLTALLIALVVNLPSLLVQGIAAATGNSLIGRLMDVMNEAVTADGAVMPLKLMNGLRELRNASGVWIMAGLDAAAWLLTACLTVGMVNWLLKLLRKQEAGDVGAVFSRAGIFFKAVGLRLFVAFRMLLWMLPGMALSALAALLIVYAPGRGISPVFLEMLVMFVSYAVTAGTTALMVMAALRYSLADMALADHPEMGPVQAARESRRMTKGRKGGMFPLVLSYILWTLAGEIVAASVVQGLFGSVPALMTEMLCSLAVSVYWYASLTSCYLTLTHFEKAVSAPGEAEKEAET